MRKIHFPRMALASVGAVAAMALTVGVLTADPAAAEECYLRPIAATVPAGQILKAEVVDESGAVVSRYLINPSARVCVYEVINPDSPARPYSSIVVYDSSGRSELDGTTLEIYETSSDGYSRIESKMDRLVGQPLNVVGHQSRDGLETLVVETELESKEGISPVRITGYVDVATGLLVREEIVEGLQKVVIVQETVRPEAEEYASLRRDQLPDLATRMRQQRLRSIGEMSPDLAVLPHGLGGLSLLWVVPSGEYDYVRLDYQASDAPGRSVAAMRVWFEPPSDYPTKMLVPLSEATEEDLDSATRVCFAQGGIAIQIIAEKELGNMSAMNLAKSLVPFVAAELEQ